MKVAVYMADGRHVHVLERRADLLTLVTRTLNDIDRAQPIACVTRHHHEGAFEPGRLLYLRAHSIAQVVPVATVAAAAKEPTP